MVACLRIIAGIVCALWALQQFRMTLIYMGILSSSIVGQLASPQPALMRIALLDVLKYIGFAIVLFAEPWPVLVTYLFVVLSVKSALDFSLVVFDALFNVGRFKDIQLTAKMRVYNAVLELVPCAFYLVAVVISGHFLGWRA